MTQYIIQDWAGNIMKFKGRPYLYDSFEDAEDVLFEKLDENFEIDASEYYIVEVDHDSSPENK